MDEKKKQEFEPIEIHKQRQRNKTVTINTKKNMKMADRRLSKMREEYFAKTKNSAKDKSNPGNLDKFCAEFDTKISFILIYLIINIRIL